MAPQRDIPTELLDDHRALEPPDPIPNSAVKRRIADGSVGFPHARVGHRQAPTADPRAGHGSGVFAWLGRIQAFIGSVLFGSILRRAEHPASNGYFQKCSNRHARLE